MFSSYDKAAAAALLLLVVGRLEYDVEGCTRLHAPPSAPAELDVAADDDDVGVILECLDDLDV